MIGLRYSLALVAWSFAPAFWSTLRADEVWVGQVMVVDSSFRRGGQTSVVQWNAQPAGVSRFGSATQFHGAEAVATASGRREAGRTGTLDTDPWAGKSNALLIERGGFENAILVDQTGHDNAVNATVTGMGNALRLEQSGVSNTVVVIQSGSNNSVVAVQGGQGNLIRLVQR